MAVCGLKFVFLQSHIPCNVKHKKNVASEILISEHQYSHTAIHVSVMGSRESIHIFMVVSTLRTVALLYGHVTLGRISATVRSVSLRYHH